MGALGHPEDPQILGESLIQYGTPGICGVSTKNTGWISFTAHELLQLHKTLPLLGVETSDPPMAVTPTHETPDGEIPPVDPLDSRSGVSLDQPVYAMEEQDLPPTNSFVQCVTQHFRNQYGNRKILSVPLNLIQGSFPGLNSLSKANPSRMIRKSATELQRTFIYSRHNVMNYDPLGIRVGRRPPVDPSQENVKRVHCGLWFC